MYSMTRFKNDKSKIKSAPPAKLEIPLCVLCRYQKP